MACWISERKKKPLSKKKDRYPPPFTFITLYDEVLYFPHRCACPCVTPCFPRSCGDMVIPVRRTLARHCFAFSRRRWGYRGRSGNPCPPSPKTLSGLVGQMQKKNTTVCPGWEGGQQQNCSLDYDAGQGVVRLSNPKERGDMLISPNCLSYCWRCKR